MLQTVKVLAININHDELVDISNAFDKMIAKTDLQNMAEAIERKIEKLRNEQEEVEEAMNEVQNATDYLSNFAE